MSLRRSGLILYTFLALTCCRGSQSIDAIDSQLARYLNRVEYWSNYDYLDSTVDKYDSLGKANAMLTDYLTSVGNIPVTIEAEFPKAKKSGLSMVTSEDKKLRFYTWDTYLGGTMVNYSNIAQFNSSGKMKAIEMKDTSDEGDYGCYYQDIVTIRTKDNKDIYLAFEFNKVSTKDRAEGVTAYTIEHQRLRRYDLFKTKTRTINSIGYGYDAFSSSEKLKQDFDKLPSIHLSKDKKQLFIPVVAGEDLTARYLIYQFDGEKFVYTKIGN